MNITCYLLFLYKRPVSILILLKHWGCDNFELKWFHALSKSRAIPFSQVSANSFRVNIQKCSRSLNAFIAFRPTCFAWRLVMRNLHETSTQHARYFYPDSKNNSRRITYGIGCVWGMPSLSPLSSLYPLLSFLVFWHFILILRWILQKIVNCDFAIFAKQSDENIQTWSCV